MNLLVLCENIGNLKNVHPVLNLLKGYTDLNVIYYNLDVFFQQNTRSNFINKQIITPPLIYNDPFYRLNKFAKLNTLRALKRNIILKRKIDLIIAGSFGVIEYTIAKEIIKYNANCKLVFIQDSILLQSEKYIKDSILDTFRNYYYKNDARQNICDKIFVSGEATKNVLVSDGVDNKIIEVTGIPRFSYLFESQSAKIKKNKVLILLGATEWHGCNNNLIQFERIVINKISKIIIGNTIPYNLVFRPHPRGKIDMQKSLNKNIEDIKYKSINDSIIESDLIVSIGYPSTSLFESILLGKNAYLIKDKQIEYKVTDQDIYDKTINIIKLDDFIFKIKNDLINQDKDVKLNYKNHHFISDCTPNAARLITDVLLKITNQGNTTND